MNHYSIRPCLSESKSSLQSIFHTLFQNQTFDSGTNHKVLGSLGILACPDFLGKGFNTILCLLHLCPEERIFLQSRLILYNHHGYPKTFQASHSIHKVLLDSAGISIKNNGFRSNLGNILNGSETGAHIHKLNIRLSLSSGIAERAYPHGVKLVSSSLLIDLGLLNNQTGKSVMSLHGGNQPLQLQLLFQSSSSYIRHGKLRFGSFFQLCVLFFLMIGKFN